MLFYFGLKNMKLCRTFSLFEISKYPLPPCQSSPLINIPLIAPTPVPTITAVGVARPSAQGQAIANTRDYRTLMLLLAQLFDNQGKTLLIGSNF